MTDVLVKESRQTVGWLASKGVQFRLSFERQAYEVDSVFKFWGGLVLSTVDGGKGLVSQELSAAERAGIEIWYETNTKAILTHPDTGRLDGVQIAREGKEGINRARGGVVLACGGFESDQRLRAEHLGPSWAHAHVRGTPHNTGDGLSLVAPLNAALAGDWQGCHATCWDVLSDKDVGDPDLTNQYTKSGYPLGVIVNKQGKRFVDEGADMRNYTYAKIGREILKQPDGVAFQIYDGKTIPWLRSEEYSPSVTQRLESPTLASLSSLLSHSSPSALGPTLDDPATFLKTVQEFIEAVESGTSQREREGRKWDPSTKDGLMTVGLDTPKCNWALTIDTPPFLAVKVTTGVTFTFGVLSIDPHTAGVKPAAAQRRQSANTDAHEKGSGDQQKESDTIPGMYAAGEVVGGLFWGNYPGGSGLTAGAVFGRRAGRSAALAALDDRAARDAVTGPDS